MGTLKARVSGTWVPVLGSGFDAANTARWNSAWGQVASVPFTQGSVDVSAGQTPILSNQLSFTFISGRRYLLEVRLSSLGLLSGTSSQVAYYVRRVGTTTTVGDSDQWVITTGNYAGSILRSAVNGDGSTLNIEAAVEVVTGGNVRIGSRGLTIYDEGPVTPASIAPPTAGPRVVAEGNALGIIAKGALVTGVPLSIAANTPTSVSTPVNVTLAVGRRYRVVGLWRATQAPAACTIRSMLYDGGVDKSSTYGDRYFWLANSYEMHIAEWLIDGDGAAHSFVWTATSGAAFSPYLDYGHFYVEDVGPNTYPALPIPATPPAWTALTYNSGWSFPVSGGYTNRSQSSYRKIGDIVYLRVTGQNAGGQGTPICTLPVGFRPPGVVDFIGRDKAGACVFNVNTTGEVYWYGTNPNAASPDAVNLNCSFSTTA